MVRTYLNRAVINFYDIDLEKETDLRALEIMQRQDTTMWAPAYIERMRIETQAALCQG